MPAGSTIALIGPTGCGKTTLTALVPRFYDVTAGRVLVDGVDVRDLSLVDLRRDIGVVTEDTFLFSASVRENIAFGAPWATDDDVASAAERAQATEFIESLPDGYATQIGERGLTLSGGQRQRIAIARALLVDPRILILDDATAAVDATTEAKIKRALQEVMRGRTTIIIAHRLSTISLAERVVVMDQRPHRRRRHARGAGPDERAVQPHPHPRPPRPHVRRPRRRPLRAAEGGRDRPGRPRAREPAWLGRPR